MSQTGTPSAATRQNRPDPRAAALAAAEARTRALGQPAPSSPSATGSASAAGAGGGPAGGLFRPPNAASSSSSNTTGTRFSPTEKEERDTRIKFSRLLDRGLVRDNGYKQVADGVEVS